MSMLARWLRILPLVQAVALTHPGARAWPIRTPAWSRGSVPWAPGDERSNALRSLPRGGPWTVALLLLTATGLLAQEPGTVEGIVVDAESGEPVSGVEVRIDGVDVVVVTGDGGGFRVVGVPGGTRRLTLRHLAYGEHERTLVLERGALLRYEVRMSRQAIELAPLLVEVGPEALDPSRVEGNPANVIELGTIEATARTGATLMTLLRREVPGIRFREGNCLEYRAQGFTVTDPATGDLVGQNCRQMAVFMDGVRMQESASFLIDMNLEQLERVEVLSPAMAGVRYGGDGAYGVILLETKQGLAPQVRSGRVAYTGFAWHDVQPYRWPRVFGTTLLANAAATAVTFGLFLDCAEAEPLFDGNGQCLPGFAVGAGVVAGTVGGLLTHWAGKSILTEGRTFPVMAVGTASAVGSYLLVRQAEIDGSDGARTVGLALSTAGTTLLMTLADRVFRVGR